MTIAAVGPQQVEAARLIVVRSALRLEIKTGMKRSNRGRSTLAIANEAMGTNHRTKEKAYAALNALMVEAGFEDRPL